jgi:hypothetical protein
MRWHIYFTEQSSLWVPHLIYTPSLHIPFRLTKLDFCGADDEKREYISQSLNFTASRAK